MKLIHQLNLLPKSSLIYSKELYLIISRASKIKARAKKALPITFYSEKYIRNYKCLRLN